MVRHPATGQLPNGYPRRAGRVDATLNPHRRHRLASTRLGFFLDRAQALEAVGLPE
jgi:hypothetical protein